MTGCKLERNDIRFFFCWGVKWGLVEKNSMLDNKRFGVSIGHNDTGNVVRNNEVLRSGKTGIYLRQEHGPAFSPSRNHMYIPQEKVLLAVQLLVEGNSIRSTERISPS